MNALCLHHHHRRISLPFRAAAGPTLKTRKGCHRNPPRASFGDDEEEEQGDENKTPLSSLNFRHRIALEVARSCLGRANEVLK